MPTDSRQKPSTPFQTVPPGVVLPPRSQQRFQHGITAIVEAIRPTLGPLPRLVAVSRTHPGDAPELLDDGGLIARRIIALADRDADMGAMFIRQVLWRLREEVGDGTVSAAVMFKSIYDEGIKHLEMGGNALRLRAAIERFLPDLLAELSRLAIPLQGSESLQQFAKSICPDDQTAQLLSEIFDVIGENGFLEITNANGKQSEREYVEGAFWESGLASRSMLNDPRYLIARLENAALIVTDLEINDAKSLLPVLRMVLESKQMGFAILARKFSDDAAALLVNATNSGRLTAIGIKTPGTGESDQYANLQDLSLITGGRALLSTTGDSLDSLRAEDFGHARRIWADSDRFGIVGGKGDPMAVRLHLANLIRAENASDSNEARKKLRARIGRVNGGIGRLLVGGQTTSEQKHRREQTERASLVMRAALGEGILPGGGAAYLACRSVLDAQPGENEDFECAAARRILYQALGQPSLTIAANAGYKLLDLPPGKGFNALTGLPADMLADGIMDSAGVVKAALIAAVKGAALALTVDTLIHRAKPRFSPEP